MKIPIIVVSCEWPSTRDRGASQITQAIARTFVDNVAIWNANTGSVFEIIRFFGHSVRRESVEAFLNSLRKRKALFVFYGHGCSCGSSLLESLDVSDAIPNPLLDCDNSETLQNKVVYVVACHSARTFGPNAIRDGAISYIGYTGRVVVSINGQRLKGIEKCLNAGLAVLVERGGCSAAARDAIYRQYTYYIEKHWSENAGASPYIIAMSMNRRCLVPQAIGSQIARIR
jgi:hypothetical protein